jgi:tRNA1(Val) A37 N6-methylase TrmN6
MAGGDRQAVGIELEPKFIEAYQKVCETENMQLMTMINDDSNNMLQHPEVSETVFDLVIADPPYSDMMSKERTGQRKKLYNDSSPMLIQKISRPWKYVTGDFFQH